MSSPDDSETSLALCVLIERLGLNAYYTNRLAPVNVKVECHQSTSTWCNLEMDWNGSARRM